MTVGAHIYDLYALSEEFDYGEARVADFVDAAHTDHVLEARSFDGRATYLVWVYGVPNAVSYQTLHERWLKLPDEERRRHEEVLEALGRHKVDTWILS